MTATHYFSQRSPAENAPPNWRGPPLSMIYFAGNMNDTYDYPSGWTYRTLWGHRYPSCYSNGLLKGTGINTVSIVEQEIELMASAGVTAICFDFYLPASIVEPNDPRQQSEWLQAGLEAYLQASNKSKIQFWVMPIWSDTNGISYPSTNNWKYRTDFSNYITNLMADPQYLRIQKGPVLGIFGSGGTGPAANLADWDTFVAPMGGRSNLFTIEMSGSNAVFGTLLCDARLKYGVQNLTAGQGHKPFTTSSDADKIYWTQALSGSERRIAQFNLTNDARALDASAGTRTWCDQPTHPQMLAHIDGAVNLNGSVMAIGIWNELAEEGPVPPTAQDGDVKLRAIRQVRSGIRPTYETYKVNAANADTAIVASNGAGWTYVDPFTASASYHDRDYVVSSTAGDSKELQHQFMTSCNVYADKGPDVGILELWKDGVLNQTIDCYAASPTTSALVGTVTYSSPTTGQVRARVTGTKNASSSSAQIRLDFFEPTYRV